MQAVWTDFNIFSKVKLLTSIKIYKGTVARLEIADEGWLSSAYLNIIVNHVKSVPTCFKLCLVTKCKSRVKF